MVIKGSQEVPHLLTGVYPRSDRPVDNAVSKTGPHRGLAPMAAGGRAWLLLGKSDH